MRCLARHPASWAVLRDGPTGCKQHVLLGCQAARPLLGVCCSSSSAEFLACSSNIKPSPLLSTLEIISPEALLHVLRCCFAFMQAASICPPCVLAHSPLTSCQLPTAQPCAHGVLRTRLLNYTQSLQRW